MKILSASTVYRTYSYPPPPHSLFTHPSSLSHISSAWALSLQRTPTVKPSRVHTDLTYIKKIRNTVMAYIIRRTSLAGPILFPSDWFEAAGYGVTVEIAALVSRILPTHTTHPSVAAFPLFRLPLASHIHLSPLRPVSLIHTVRVYTI